MSLLEPDPANDVKAQRRLEPRDDDQFKVPTVPVEWMSKKFILFYEMHNSPTDQFGVNVAK